MKELYRRMWQLAKPYYEKGRIYDIPHIEWFMEQVERICKQEGLDESLLMPIAILHDVGYSVDGKENPCIKCQDSKRKHMIEGARIAEQILGELKYDRLLSRKIVHYISVHDNWVFGDDAPFRECIEMAVFNDLDFLYSISSLRIIRLQAESLGRNPAEMIDFWMTDEKHRRRPFATETTRSMWERCIEERRKELIG